MTHLIIILLVVAAAIVLYYFLSKRTSAFASFIPRNLITAGFEDLNEDYCFLGGRKRKFDLFLQDPWYDLVASGKKTLEARVGPADKWIDLVGQTIKCKSGKDKKTQIQILDRRHYATIDEALDKEKIDRLIPGAKTKAAAKEAMLAIKNKAGEAVFDPARVASLGGIIIFELKLAA